MAISQFAQFRTPGCWRRPSLTLPQALHVQAGASIGAFKWTWPAWCTKQVQRGVAVASIATVSVLLGWALTHSCIVRSQYWHAIGLENAADSFRPVEATVRSLELHHCQLLGIWRRPKCWPFGGVQPAASGWVEGTFTYEWNEVPYASASLSSASVRSRLWRYDDWMKSQRHWGHLQVTAWVDPDNPGTAVLDRTHYIQPEGPWKNRSSMCDEIGRAHV